MGTFRNVTPYDATVVFKITAYDSSGNRVLPEMEWSVSVPGSTTVERSYSSFVFQSPGTYTFVVKSPDGREQNCTVTVTEAPPPQPPNIEIVDVWFKCKEYRIGENYYSCSEVWRDGDTVGPYDWVHAELWAKARNTGGEGTQEFRLTAYNCDFGRGVTEKTVRIAVDANTTANVELADVFVHRPGSVKVCWEKI